MSQLRFPLDHDSRCGDLIALWRVLERAGTKVWDEATKSTYTLLPSTDRYRKLCEKFQIQALQAQHVERPSHDQVVASLKRDAQEWDALSAASAFCAGLSSAPAAWRSAMNAVLMATVLPDHESTPYESGSSAVCQICGYAPTALQPIEQFSTIMLNGSPIDGVPTGLAAALGFMSEGRPEPTEYDRWSLGAIRAVIQAQPPGTRYSTVAKSIRDQKILRGTRAAVSVLEDLALAGVLAGGDYPGLAESFTSYVYRDRRPSVRVEVQAPLAWWGTSIGDRGIRTEIFDLIFGHLAIPEVDLEAARPQPSVELKKSIDGGLAARVRALSPKERRSAPSVGSGSAKSGDVWAMRLEPGRWVTLYVHEVAEFGSRPYAHVEFMVGVFEDQPVEGQITLISQPRTTGRWATWCHSLEKTSWTRRIAQSKPVPQAEGELPDGSKQAAKNLRHLADWCFS